MQIDLTKYSYSLPKEKIASYPLEKRDHSKLLVYKNGQISHKLFYEIEAELTDDDMLVFNETKVIQARLIFRKETGARIEVFCLEPNNLNDEISTILEKKQKSLWKCFVGNKRKWKAKDVLTHRIQLEDQETVLQARQTGEDGRYVVIEFNWNSDHSFSEILSAAGKVPIPPYLDRKAEEGDAKNYQTIYARQEGAVAAPTAGLHFTPELLKRLDDKGLKKEFIRLHVSAGTFQPISTEDIMDHPMHNEQIVFSQENILNLLNHPGRLICVGTTSLRALESLYWFGAGLLNGMEKVFSIDKLFPYSLKEDVLPTRREALKAVLDHMEQSRNAELMGETRIFIFPSYRFRMCDGLITNYHLPKSTLILLVAAFVGENWTDIYKEALSENYRFLSYGDSSLLLP
jgi:S-adenosylmethionine:tRNA ribosyltransferase-isomerase